MQRFLVSLALVSSVLGSVHSPANADFGSKAINNFTNKTTWGYNRSTVDVDAHVIRITNGSSDWHTEAFKVDIDVPTDTDIKGHIKNGYFSAWAPEGLSSILYSATSGRETENFSEIANTKIKSHSESYESYDTNGHSVEAATGAGYAAY